MGSWNRKAKTDRQGKKRSALKGLLRFEKTVPVYSPKPEAVNPLFYIAYSAEFPKPAFKHA